MRPFSWLRWLRSLSHPQTKTYRRRPQRDLCLERLENRLAPATFTWSGLGGANTKWSNNANWMGNVAPTGATASLDDLVFGAGASQRITSNDLPLISGVSPTFNSITISASNYSLAGNKIVLGSSSVSGSGSILVNTGSAGEVISLDVQ